MNAQIEIEQTKAARTVDVVPARCELHEEFRHNSRRTSAHAMQFTRLRASAGLNSSLRDGLIDEPPRLDLIQWEKFDARKFVKLRPDMSEAIPPVRAACDPDWNLLTELPDEPRNTWRSPNQMIKSHRLASAFQIRQQPIFAIDNIQLAMGPSKLRFQAVAETRLKLELSSQIMSEDNSANVLQ